ncbi:MAG: hypothetical protein IBJ11_11200 [Phycisphaerales bacterium]|nr:hypothetical protein [Phycisphaerales bacterium]
MLAVLVLLAVLPSAAAINTPDARQAIEAVLGEPIRPNPPRTGLDDGTRHCSAAGTTATNRASILGSAALSSPRRDRVSGTAQRPAATPVAPCAAAFIREALLNLPPPALA